ncbi:phospholipase A [Dasania sp. GY-MA-18]|uniref:Phospholipase A1 n=1 Tax=Dasania phycosphaerae TaxID=2950436 RepID=A0A9J6RKH8_9GAMM|nr:MULTISPECIES: phospholipase A [Dasania]MCR8922480.1 phospholipase A [Dasania sp. GY-MA-18]MCZ0864908.1 phospholipase A [Dasania phycosphaerae]MCZ0868636.1 phospholipase A [Dasania phycosphaerae]
MQFVPLLIIVWLAGSSLAQANTMDACLLDAISKAVDKRTVSDIKAFCREKNGLQQEAVPATEVVDENLDAEETVTLRMASEDQAESNPFMLTAYKPNYLLFATYNENPNSEPWQQAYPDAHLDHGEAKFQLSFKARMAKGVLGGELWGAYTQQSWWQVFNSDESAPFRETNYEPEVMLRWEVNNHILGFKNRVLSLSFNHESNGRGEVLSRSWNRIIATTTLEKENLVIVGRAWYRIHESERDDDNPNIERYMGYGDLNLLYKMQRHTFGLTFTNNLRSDNKSGLQLDWTFPLTERFKGYIQYYNGYGESLIDYDKNINRIGFGVLLNDWL